MTSYATQPRNKFAKNRKLCANFAPHIFFLPHQLLLCLLELVDALPVRELGRNSLSLEFVLGLSQSRVDGFAKRHACLHLSFSPVFVVLRELMPGLWCRGSAFKHFTVFNQTSMIKAHECSHTCCGSNFFTEKH